MLKYSKVMPRLPSLKTFGLMTRVTTMKRMTRMITMISTAAMNVLPVRFPSCLELALFPFPAWEPALSLILMAFLQLPFLHLFPLLCLRLLIPALLPLALLSILHLQAPPLPPLIPPLPPPIPPLLPPILPLPLLPQPLPAMTFLLLQDTNLPNRAKPRYRKEHHLNDMQRHLQSNKYISIVMKHHNRTINEPNKNCLAVKVTTR
ncbi:hypothetical protein K450DRAFT_263495 [Umbelopsis ramanniana AG]|uniref:Uncharacterized protein n=1 Tax=Umbelopsis ramanniana AG TaxID=1314678 RepID=A0AAD5H7I7_UMBRA|nr:uncharacterized protein K450DRAFT_263495 [Umbelopsis ramanniana AG]KAI8575072.1 hypothetical protein K450DRAFT_263495 [Umbelopsis ramanniana AG]